MYSTKFISEITPKEVKTLIIEGKELSIIDVREYHEVCGGKIENAKHIPLGQIMQRFNELDKETEHIIVCRSGNRSELAAEWLQQRGLKVKNMLGGMIEWVRT